MSAVATIPVTQPLAAFPTSDEIATILDLAQKLVPTGFLPEAIKTPAQAAAIMLKGRELGIPPMYALSNIAIIKGKPTCGSELMIALIKRDHGDNATRFIHTDNDRATLRYKRRDATDYAEYTFTIKDAERAGLTSNTWKQYPATMLRWRCTSAVAKMEFADSIGGMYVPEELGAAVTVVDDQVVIDSRSVAVDARAREVIDIGTGEIIDAPSDAQIAPQRGEADSYDPNNEERRKKGMKAVFAVAKTKRLTDDDVKLMAYKRFEVTSMTALSVEDLGDFWKHLNETDQDDLMQEAYEAHQAASEADTAEANQTED